VPFAPSPTQQAYNDALLAAREDWLKEEEVTVAAIQQAYGKAVNDMAFDLAAMDAQGRQVIRGPATRAWYDEIRVNLDGYRQNISAQTLAATRNGIVLAYNTGLSTGDVHTDYLDAYTQGGHSISMLGLKESEALSYYARNGKNGVVLSDKVWGSTAKFQTDMSTAIQTAVISGQSARDLARELDNMVLRLNSGQLALALLPRGRLAPLECCLPLPDLRAPQPRRAGLRGPHYGRELLAEGNGAELGAPQLPLRRPARVRRPERSGQVARELDQRPGRLSRPSRVSDLGAGPRPGGPARASKPAQGGAAEGHASSQAEAAGEHGQP